MERFWKKTIPEPNSGCLLWTGWVTEHGYGMFSFDGKRATILAHRLSWELSTGEIPKNKCVLHKCDNPPCVNPRHLFLGTRADNLDDMRRKGRERNVHLRFTREQAADIRARFLRGESQGDIASLHNTTKTTVRNIGIGNVAAYREVV